EDQQYVLYDNKDLQYLKIVTDTLSKYHPNSKIVSAMKADLQRGTQSLISQQVNKIIQSEELGEAVLDPNLVDSKGNRVALSSLRGKYVLLDFYSFNSTDCVANNEELKQIYKTYHKKGFEIYQINIDESEDEWRTYINFEDFPWISLREDDPYYLENARLFNVRTLPANYLFDTKGNIIASNLFGRSLKIKLDQIFN
ncbi:MAG: TlpA family protein disulfide reductase, partial [Bacteroidales bacterium]|nr:TlpA family protein disulfide reductase [Bacteroidales bacterium]